jgi:hypothetical protein
LSPSRGLEGLADLQSLAGAADARSDHEPGTTDVHEIDHFGH